MRQLNLTITDELRRKLKQKALDEDTTVTVLVRQKLDELVI